MLSNRIMNWSSHKAQEPPSMVEWKHTYTDQHTGDSISHIEGIDAATVKINRVLSPNELREWANMFIRVADQIEANLPTSPTTESEA